MNLNKRTKKELIEEIENLREQLRLKESSVLYENISSGELPVENEFYSDEYDPVFICSKDGFIEEININAERLLECSQSELKGKHISSIVKNGEPTSSPFESLQSIDQPFVSENIIITRNGKEICAEINSVLLPDGRVRGVVRSIVDRIRIAENLKQSEKSYKDLFNSSSDLIYIQDEEGTFIDVNDQVLKKYGYIREEIIGKKADLFGAPGMNDPDQISGYFQRALNGETVWFDWWAITKTGLIFPKELVLKRGYYFGKNVIVATGRDISERKAIEKTISESREKYRNLIKGLQTGVIISLNGKIVFINQFALSILEIKENPKEILFEDYHTYFSPDLISRILNVSHSPKQISGHVITAHGNKVEIEGSAAITDFEGAPATQIIFSNLSEVKKAEKQLKEQEHHLAMILNNIDYITYRFSFREGKKPQISFVSRQVRNILGMSREKFIELIAEGKLRESYHPDDIPALVRAGEEVKAGKKAIHCLYRVKNEEKNQYIWLEESIFLQETDENGIRTFFGIAKDVTQRMVSEEALKDSEKRYRTLVERNLAGVFKTDMQRNITSCNEAFAQIFGYPSATSMIGLNTAEIYQDSSDKFDFLEKLSVKGFINNHESFIKLNSGKNVWLLENVSLVFDKNHEPQEIEGTILDITELKKAEQKLRKSEQQYRSLFENNLAGVFRTSLDGQFLECNEAFARVLGYNSKDELYTLAAGFIYFSNEEREEYLSTLLATGKLNNYQMRLKRKDGKEIWILANVSLVEEEDGTRVIEGTLIDITQLIRTQRTLSVSERKFRLLSESAPIGIFLTDSKGIPLYVNTVIEDICAKTAEEICGEDLTSFLINEDRNLIVAQFNEAINGQQPFDGEFRILRHEEIRWVKVNSRILWDEKGELSGWVGTLEDITTRKLTEERVKESEKRFRLLSEAAIEGIVFTEEGTIIDVNDRFVTMHGFHDRNEVIGKPLSEFFLSGDIRKIPLGTEGKDMALEIRSRRKDGSLITLEARGETIPFHGRSIKISVLYDISERKKYEEALRENERTLSTLLSNLPGMAYRCLNDADWTMTFTSTGSISLTGFKPEELVNNAVIPFNEIIHPQDRNKNTEYLNHCLKEKMPFTVEYRIISRNNEVKWVWEQGEGVYDSSGKLVAIEGFITDISERKEYEKQLKQSREGYKNLIQTSPLGIFIVKNEEVFFANNKAKQLFDWPEFDPDKETLPFPLEEYILPEFLGSIRRRIKDVYEGKNQPFMEIKIKNIKGEVKEVETASSLVDYLGEPCIQIVIQDVSIRKQLEREQLRAEIAEETNRNLQREINERVKAQRLLTEAQKFTRSIIDSSLDVICATNRFGELIEFNEAAERAFGYKCEEVLGKNFGFLYADQRDFDRVIQTINEEGGFSGEVINIDKSGKEFTSYLSASVLRNEDGELIGTMGVSRDITPIKEAENELRQSRERYKALFNQAFVGIARISLDGKFVQVNQRLAEIFRTSVQKLEGSSFTELTFTQDPALQRRFNKEFIQCEKENFIAEKSYVSSDGSLIHTNLTVTLVKNDEGKPDYYVAVFEDVTGKVVDQRKIEEQAGKIRSLFESSTHLLYTVSKDFKLVSWNANFSEVYKQFFKSEPRQGIKLNDKLKKVFGEHHARLVDSINLSFKGKRFQFELPVTFPEGRLAWQEAFINPVVLENGDIPEVSVIAHDVTEKKQAEEKIRESLKEKEVLLKEVHHRVKNNLQVISSILSLQCSYVSDPATLNILRESQNRVKSMAFIHESLYQTADLTKIDFAEYLSNLVRNLVHSYSIKPTRIQLEEDIQPLHLGLDASIPCGLIVNELISNSLKYAFPGKQDGKIFLILKHDSEIVSITVGDNGIGLSEDFDMENTNTLGLQLVTTLVDQLGGTMERLPGAGTAFKFNFNLSDNVKD